MAGGHQFSKPLSRRSFLLGMGAIGSAFALGGCRDSDSLYNTIYADWAHDIDYNTKQKAYANVPDATPTPNLPKIYETESEAKEEEVELPEYDEETESDDDAATTKHSDDASKDNDTDSGVKENQGDEDDGGGDDDDGFEDETPASISDSDNQGKNASRNVNAKPSATGSVIAFGEMANIVLMLGGKGALWACDDPFYKVIGEVYASGTDDSVKKGYWSSYDTGTKTMKVGDFKKLHAALGEESDDKRPAFIIYDGGIGCPLTKKQLQKLEDDYGIQVVYFYLNTVDYIKNSMNYIKKILDYKLGIFEKDASKIYDAYWEFHDTLLEDVTKLAGGYAAFADGAASGKMNLSFKDGSTKYGDSKVMDEDDVLWTVLIDGWDEGVSYNNGGIKAAHGLGYTHLGCNWSPVSYYLQCGGVLNNSAAYQQMFDYDRNATRRYVWQFALEYYPPSGKYLSGARLTSSNEKIKPAGEDNLLELMMLAKNGKFGLGKLDDNGHFPGVIVRTKAAKKKMAADCKSSKGVYASHYLKAGETKNNKKASAGVVYTGKADAQWRSFVGYVGDDEEVSSAYNGAKEPYDIHVNPCGAYSSWIDGSVESFLEAPWAYAAFYKGSATASIGSTAYGSSASDIISAFYETFYGKRPSSSLVSEIIEGGRA